MSNPNTIHKRSVDLIGTEAVAKLQLHGLVIVDMAAVDKFMAEHKASNARIREAAAACMRAAGCVTVRTEMSTDGQHPVLIVTHPSGDEHAMAQLIGEIMVDLSGLDAGGRAPTDEERKQRQRDTNDVEIYGKAGDDEIPLAPRCFTFDASMTGEVYRTIDALGLRFHHGDNNDLEQTNTSHSVSFRGVTPRGRLWVEVMLTEEGRGAWQDLPIEAGDLFSYIDGIDGTHGCTTYRATGEMDADFRPFRHELVSAQGHRLHVTAERLTDWSEYRRWPREINPPPNEPS